VCFFSGFRLHRMLEMQTIVTDVHRVCLSVCRQSVCHTAQLRGACSVCGIIRRSLCQITLASCFSIDCATQHWSSQSNKYCLALQKPLCHVAYIILYRSLHCTRRQCSALLLRLFKLLFFSTMTLRSHYSELTLPLTNA